MRAVVDASALVDAVVPGQRQSAALAAFAASELWAPPLVDVEVSSSLWRLLRAGEISDAEAERGMSALHTAPIRRIENSAIVREAWGLRESVRISDAFYVAAARLLDATLITSDRRLSRAPRLGVTIVLLSHA